jgi:anhydro-N-acetylmuramic acid kinase
LVVGTMTGTSLDGLDAASVSIRGEGLAMRAELRRHASFEFPAELRTGLRAAAEQVPLTSGALAMLARNFALFHAESIAELLKESSTRADLVVAHGQTIFHAPPVSWQLLQPVPLSELLGTTVVCDLRQADLACGGQGAPITPLADWILFRASVDRAVINLGGFCNITILPAGGSPESVRGSDVCACNQVLDAVARRALACPFDVDGAAAARGCPEAAATQRLMDLLRRQRDQGRSLGTGDEAQAWVDTERSRLAAEDLAASAALAVGTVIGETPIRLGLGHDAELLLAGGGALHRPLVAAIGKAHGADHSNRVRLLDSAGVPIAAREAMEMAVLGTLAADGVPITLPRVTGRSSGRTRDGLWCFARG